MKRFIFGGFLASVIFITGCGQKAATPVLVSPQPTEQYPSDKKFTSQNLPVTFSYQRYLNAETVSNVPGSVFVIFRKDPSSPGLIDQVLFSAKTHDAWKKEMEQAALAKDRPVCESEAQFGCEKWDEDFALYQKAIKDHNYDGYYALAASTVTVNSIPFLILVTYNVDTQQYQTTYIAYTNNVRLTFVDPASGALEYGVPFHMTAKNRTLVEDTAKNIAIRRNLDRDVNTRAELLYDIVSSAVVK